MPFLFCRGYSLCDEGISYLLLHEVREDDQRCLDLRPFMARLGLLASAPDGPAQVTEPQPGESSVQDIDSMVVNVHQSSREDSTR